MSIPTDVERLLAAAQATMAKVRDCWLATAAQGGGVSVRVVSPIPGVFREEDWTIWFVTRRGSRKAAEIELTGRLALGYQYHPDRAYVSALGRAALVDDRSIIRDRWSEKFRPHFPDGPENSDAIFVRVNVDRIELCVRGVSPEPFGSRHSVIERDDERGWKIVSD
jgi:general stress protein 26